MRIEITGSAHLWGGEAALAADLAARLDRQGIACRIAIADTLGAAWALARFARSRAATRHPAAGRARAGLAPLPVEALRLDPATAQGLRRVGLKRVGDLYAMPRDALARRFGDTVARRLDQALDDLPEPLSPLGEAPVRRVRLSFAEPIADPADLALAAERLAADLVLRLAREGTGARRLDLAFHRVDGRVERIALGTARPSRDPRHLAALFRERLDTVDPGLGVEDMILAAFAVEPLPAEQIGFAGPAGPRPTLPRLRGREWRGRHRPAPRPARQPARSRTHLPARAAREPHPGARLGSVCRWRCPRSHRALRTLRAMRGQGGLSLAGRGSLGRRVHSGDGEGRRGRSGCSSRRSRSRRSGCCPTTRRSVSPGGGARIGSMRADGPERIAEEWWRPEGVRRR